ncbi:hypothetical protein BIW11_06345 [Tropilaelaps mercedesae]|uniref:Uncharacterized protein n=1 Tax=Tropilaelaps mercedesae TaxID=418985 RepID=A0A1V9XYL3_9ACAR|nr:hypothetical protein BIW11_06345 [Tropilaelaps mercedesae]
MDFESQQEPSTSMGFHSRIPRLRKPLSAGPSEDSSDELMKPCQIDEGICFVTSDIDGLRAPSSSGLPTPTDSGYPPSNCTVIPPTEDLHGFDDPDIFWNKLESGNLRRATSTPVLKDSPRHTADYKRSRKPHRRLIRALEVAVKIADQLETNTKNLLRTVEEYRQRVHVTSEQVVDSHLENES